IHVDALLTSAGWTPSLHLFSQSRGRVAWDGSQFVPGQYAQDCICVGSAAGVSSLEQILEDAIAAAGASDAAGHAVKSVESREGAFAGAAPGTGSRGKAFVDFQNDVTAKDIR